MAVGGKVTPEGPPSTGTLVRFVVSEFLKSKARVASFSVERQGG